LQRIRFATNAQRSGKRALHMGCGHFARYLRRGLRWRTRDLCGRHGNRVQPAGASPRSGDSVSACRRRRPLRT
jgi:hypothetical protein